MNDWISYLEKYRGNKLLYEKMQCAGPEFQDQSPLRQERSQMLKKLECRIHEAENHLEHYIEEDLSPKEAAKQADEKLFLFYRYICGMSMPEVVSAMSMSRDTVYRIRRRVQSRACPYA